MGWELPVLRAAENKPARRGKHRAGYGRTLTIYPYNFLSLKSDRFDAPHLAVAIRPQAQSDANVEAARGRLRGIPRDPGVVHTRFGQWHIQNVSVGIVGGRGPVSRTIRIGADELGFVGFWLERGADDLLSRFRINHTYQILQPNVFRKLILTVVAVHSIEHGHLASGDHKFRRFSIDGERDQQLLERPIDIPDIAVHVLVIPDQLAGIRIERHGGLRVEPVIGRTLLGMRL